MIHEKSLFYKVYPYLTSAAYQVAASTLNSIMIADTAHLTNVTIINIIIKRSAMKDLSKYGASELLRNVIDK